MVIDPQALGYGVVGARFGVTNDNIVVTTSPDILYKNVLEGGIGEPPVGKVIKPHRAIAVQFTNLVASKSNSRCCSPLLPHRDKTSSPYLMNRFRDRNQQGRVYSEFHLLR